jgi:hypothetical protein
VAKGTERDVHEEEYSCVGVGSCNRVSYTFAFSANVWVCELLLPVKEFERENAKLKRLVAGLSVDKQLLEDIASANSGTLRDGVCSGTPVTRQPARGRSPIRTSSQMLENPLCLAKISICLRIRYIMRGPIWLYQM